MQIVKKQKALEPKTSKKTNSPRAEKKVFSIDNSSNRDIEEDRKKAYNFENIYFIVESYIFSIIAVGQVPWNYDYSRSQNKADMCPKICLLEILKWALNEFKK